MNAPAPSEDLVVLLDDDGAAVGTIPRAIVHTDQTPLHQAFSSHLFDEDGQVLITRRALTKIAWPGVWTNSCCGHPRPGESLMAAATRRVREELSLTAQDLKIVLPSYRYRAIDVSGIVENEICPVLLGRVKRADLKPDPGEVCDIAWLPWSDAVEVARRTPQLLSPWAAEQFLLLEAAPELKDFT